MDIHYSKFGYVTHNNFLLKWLQPCNKEMSKQIWFVLSTLSRGISSLNPFVREHIGLIDGTSHENTLEV